MEPPGPPLDPPDPRIAVWERGTRRWARVGALMLLASVLLPNLWLAAEEGWFEDENGLHVHWFWEDPEWGVRYHKSPLLPQDPLPGLVLWVALAVFAWRLGTRTGLARRGMWWTASTVLVASVATPLRYYNWQHGPMPWPFEWPQLYLASAALGLLLIRTGAHVALGRGLCLFAGLCALGTVSAHFVETLGFWIRHGIESAQNLLGLGYWVIWGVVGGLLVRVGAARTPVPRTYAFAGWAFFASLTLALWQDYVSLGPNVGRYDDWTWELVLSSAYIHVRLWLRPYGALVLLVAGLFAWIASARAERGHAVAGAGHPATRD